MRAAERETAADPRGERRNPEVTIETRRATAEDALDLYARTDLRREVVQGELREMAPTGLEHGATETEVAFVLRSFLSNHPIGWVITGEVLCRLRRDPDTARAADVAFIRWERLLEGRLSPGPFEGAPDLVVEIVSPNDGASDVQREVSEWLEAGAAVVWLLFPASHGVVIWRSSGSSPELRGESEVDAEPALPGFRCRARDLFGD